MIGERRTEVGSEGGVDPGVAVTEFREQWELLHFNFQKWSKMGSCTDHLSLPLSLVLPKPLQKGTRCSHLVLDGTRVKCLT